MFEAYIDPNIYESLLSLTGKFDLMNKVTQKICSDISIEMSRHFNQCKSHFNNSISIKFCPSRQVILLISSAEILLGFVDNILLFCYLFCSLNNGTNNLIIHKEVKVLGVLLGKLKRFGFLGTDFNNLVV